MHETFGVWYKGFNLEESDDRLKKRWSGIERLIDEIEMSRIRDLYAISQGLEKFVSSPNLIAIKSKFKDEDAFFDTDKCQEELRLLCEVALVQCVEQEEDEDFAVDVSLWLSAAIFNNENPSKTEIAKRVHNKLARSASEIRKRTNLAVTKKQFSTKIDLSKELEELVDPINSENLTEILQQLIGKAEASIKRMGVNLKKENSSLLKELKLQDEELNMLWWAINQYSIDLNCLYKDLEVGELAIVAGKELSSLTEYKPGISSIESLFVKAGLREKEKVSIADAINNCKVDWLKTIIEDADVDQFQPIHFAILKKLETLDSNSWIPGWSAMTGLDEKAEINHVELAKFFYIERLSLDLIGQ